MQAQAFMSAGRARFMFDADGKLTSPRKGCSWRPRKRRDGTDGTAKRARGTDLVATQNR